jgi:Arc/MetJ family transcription regulator
MPSNLAIDDELLSEAKRLGGHRTKRETVNRALTEYVRRHKLLKALAAFDTVDFDPEYDYKSARKKR